MPAYSSQRRGMSPVTLLAIFFMLLLLGIVGTIGGLAAAGLIDLPFLAKADREPSREGWVLVPMSGRVIPAYSQIQRDDLANTANGMWNENWIPKTSVPENTLLDRRLILGRVMNHEKKAGYAFSEADFMPPGTRFGLVAGIPPGKRSITLEAGKLAGIHGLQAGDRFDLVSTIAPDKHRPPQQNAPVGLPPPQPEVKVLVNNGMIVTPVHLRNTVTTTQSLLNGPRSTAKPVEEVVIAIGPTEVAELTSALALTATVTVVARSGHPDDAKQETVTEGSAAPPPMTLIETVQGPKRQTMAFPEKSGLSEEQPVTSPSEVQKDRPPLSYQRRRPPHNAPTGTVPGRPGASPTMRVVSSPAAAHDVP